MAGDRHSADWVEDCQRYHNRLLTGPDGHWCREWDCLPIDATLPEYGPCTCGKSLWGILVYWWYEWARRILDAWEQNAHVNSGGMDAEDKQGTQGLGEGNTADTAAGSGPAAPTDAVPPP